MRIDLNLANTGSVESGRPSKNVSSQAKEVSSSTNAQEGAQLSPQIQRVGALEAQVAQAPEVRSERVAELQNALSSGSYSVSNDQIATAMLSDRFSWKAR